MRKIKFLLQFIIALFLAFFAYTGLYQPNAEQFKANLPQVSASRQDGEPEGILKINVFDVSHGDSILLQGGGKTVLVDVGDGKNKELVMSKLQQAGVKKLDAVFITHHHADHMGNMLTVLTKYPVQKIYDNGFANEGNKTSLKLFQGFKSGRYPHAVSQAGDKIELGEGYWLEILSPGSFLPPKLKKDLNNNSLVFKLHYGDFTMMFTGDIENPAEAAIAEQYGAALQADVLKVAHHGSKTSSNYRFISKVQPKYALISCGEFSKYHHPNKNVVGALQHLGAQVYTTIDNGDLTVETDGKKFNVKTSH